MRGLRGVRAMGNSGAVEYEHKANSRHRQVPGAVRSQAPVRPAGAAPYPAPMRSGPPRPPTSSRRFALLVALTAALGADAARAGDATPAPAAAPRARTTLTLEQALAGPKTGPGFSMEGWIPGKDAWLAWRGAGAERRLVEVDAESGTERAIVTVAALDAATKEEKPRPKTRMTGIGRAGPPSVIPCEDGRTVFVAHHGDVLRVDVASGAVVRMTRTTDSISDVRPSPDGRAITFVRAHDLWAAVVQDGKARTLRLTHGGSELQRNGDLDWLYPEELDAKTAAWWSPDATRVAYLALDETQVPRFPLVAYEETGGSVEWLQYPKAGEPNPVPSVHVVGLDGAAPVALDLGPDRDVYVPWATWWPDGSKVAVAILDRAQTRFELRLCDPAGGPGTTFLVETDAHWVDVPLPPRFLASRKAFVWTSRRDGFWRHWLAPLDGGEPRALTPAGVDVEGGPIAIDEAAGTIWWSAPSQDLWHDVIWKAPLDGGDPVAFTDDVRSHDVLGSPTARFFVDTAARLVEPRTTVLRRADGTEVRRLAAEATPAYAALALEAPELVRVPGPEGTTGLDLPALVFGGRDLDPSRPRPVVVHTYGGPGARLTKDAFGGGHLLEHLLAREGYVVLVVDGRGSGGRGKAFEAVVHRRLGEVEVADQARAVRWLAQRPGVDGTRVGIWGWSYGGFMACAALVRAPDVFDAAVAVASVTDWQLNATINTQRDMARPQENADGYKTTAPARRAAEVRGALLLCHGLADDNVHAQNTIHMAEAMLQAGKRCEVALYAHRAHGIEGEKAHRDLFGRLVAHFKQHLLDAPTGGK